MKSWFVHFYIKLFAGAPISLKKGAAANFLSTQPPFTEKQDFPWISSK